MDFLENTTKVSTIYWINYLFFAIETLLQLQCATKIISVIKELICQIPSSIIKTDNLLKCYKITGKLDAKETYFISKVK